MNQYDAEVLFAIHTLELRILFQYGLNGESVPGNIIKQQIQELLNGEALSERAKIRVSDGINMRSINSIVKGYRAKKRELEKQAQLRYFSHAYTPKEKIEVVDALIRNAKISTISDYDGETTVMLTNNNKTGAVLFNIGSLNSGVGLTREHPFSVYVLPATGAMFHVCKNIFQSTGLFCQREPKYTKGSLIEFKLYADDESPIQKQVITIGGHVHQAATPSDV